MELPGTVGDASGIMDLRRRRKKNVLCRWTEQSAVRIREEQPCRHPGQGRAGAAPELTFPGDSMGILFILFSLPCPAVGEALVGVWNPDRVNSGKIQKAPARIWADQAGTVLAQGGSAILVASGIQRPDFYLSTNSLGKV